MDYYLDNDSWTWSRFVETAKSMTDVSAGEYGFTGWMLFPYMGPYQMIGLDNETGQATLSIDSGKYVVGSRRSTTFISATGLLAAAMTCRNGGPLSRREQMPCVFAS